MLTVDPRYFDTIGLQLTRGRGFTDTDGTAGNVTAVINQRFVQMHFRQEDPIGHRIVLSMDLGGGPPPTGGIPTSLTATIIGIAPNVRQRNVSEADAEDRKSTRLNSSHANISYAVFCLKKKST